MSLFRNHETIEIFQRACCRQFAEGFYFLLRKIKVA